MDGAPFPYPGSKTRHADWVLEHLPEHTCYVEPFGGAGGVLFNKPRSNVEVYNDLDGNLVQFFETLRERPTELREWCQRVPFSRGVFEEWVADFYNDNHPDDPVKRAGRFLFLRYAQFGALYGERSGFAGLRSRNFARSYQEKLDMLEGFADRFADVIIENVPYGDVLSRYDGGETVFYLDPPYVGTEHRYREDKFDHREFYNTIADLDAKVLVSYDSVPSWFGEGFQAVSKGANNATTGGPSSEREEFLLLNFDAGGERLMSGVGQQTLETFAENTHDGGPEEADS